MRHRKANARFGDASFDVQKHCEMTENIVRTTEQNVLRAWSVLKYQIALRESCDYQSYRDLSPQADTIKIGKLDTNIKHA